MLKHGEINPLNVHGLRRVSTHCPPHFVRVVFTSTSTSNQKKITDWIWENLHGRFYLAEDQQSNTIAAFELPDESTFFSLTLSTITDI